MVVTEITPLDKRRCKVSFEDGFALVLYKGEIRKYEIEQGEEFPEERYREIVETVLFKRARERVLYLLKSSDKTETQVRRKLGEGGYPSGAIDYAVDFCKKYGYINDDTYAEHYIEWNKNRKSRLLLGYELQQKGIPRDVIERLMEAASPDEEEQVKRLLGKKGYTGKDSDPKVKQKLRMFLLRKGFSGEIVSRVMGSEDWEF